VGAVTQPKATFKNMTIVISYWEKLPGTIILKKRFLRTNLFAAASLILLSCFASAFAQADWTLHVDGAVNNYLNLTMDQLVAMPETTVEADLYCEGVLVTSGNWTGVKLSKILQTAGLKSQAESVAFSASDGYSVTIPLVDAMRDDVIVAYSLNNEILSEETRLVLPGANGASWIAMITLITVTTSSSASPGGISAGLNVNGFDSTAPDQTQPSDTQAPVPSPAPTPTLTPSNQTATSANTSPKEPKSQLEEDSPTSSNGEQYAYMITFAVILIAATTAVMGYLARKRKMRTKI
jgi:DMSO/TMAO reductase YedYZ molybdopterin-dependent catalytic subunit